MSRLEDPPEGDGAAIVMGFGDADVSNEHIDALIASLLPHVTGGPSSTLLLHGYMPPYKREPGFTPPDFMEFWLSAPGKEDVAFSINFGGNPSDRQGFETLTLERLQEVARDYDPINVSADVANFDELWLFTCKLAQTIGIANIKISYGI